MCETCEETAKKVREMAAAVGKAQSNAFDAAMNSAKAASTTESMEKLLYQWHEDDTELRKALEKRVHSLEGIKQKIVGIGIGVAIFLTFIFNVGAWGVGYAWDAFQRAIH